MVLVTCISLESSSFKKSELYLLFYFCSKISLPFFFFFGVPLGFRDLRSTVKDGTGAPAVKAPSPSHQTTREVPRIYFYPHFTVEELKAR